MMTRLTTIDWVSLILVIVGGLNWGLVAINENWDAVALLAGGYSPLARIIYGLVGLAALYLIFVIGRFARR